MMNFALFISKWVVMKEAPWSVARTMAFIPEWCPLRNVIGAKGYLVCSFGIIVFNWSLWQPPSQGIIKKKQVTI